MMYRWLVRGAHRMELPGTKQRDEHISGRAVHDFASRNWLSAFIDHWIGRKPAVAPREAAQIKSPPSPFGLRRGSLVASPTYRLGLACRAVARKASEGWWSRGDSNP